MGKKRVNGINSKIAIEATIEIKIEKQQYKAEENFFLGGGTKLNFV